jgi:hypothetical protein
VRFRPPSIAILFSLIMLASAPAWAGGFLSPFIGNNFVFVGDAGHCASAADRSSKHFTYDFSFGFMSGDAIGVEEDISYAPHFFGRAPLFGNNSLFSGMTNLTNLIVGVPPGPIRPYVSGGGGLVHTRAHLALSSLDNGNDIPRLSRRRVSVLV